jgi:hypothetical protein
MMRFIKAGRKLARSIRARGDETNFNLFPSLARNLKKYSTKKKTEIPVSNMLRPCIWLWVKDGRVFSA